MIVIFLVSLLIIRNITKDKEDVKNEESNIVNVIQSDSMQEDSMSDVMEGDEDNLPVEPKFPGIEIPEIIE